MKFNAEEFIQWEHKCVTLLGMSGVGKTRLSSLLEKSNWFHYSVDYRIGSHYLDQAILENIKNQIMQIPFIHDLLASDSIRISNHITVDHLKPISAFLGKLGDPGKGGLALREFRRRQALHHDAEVAALMDVPGFIHKTRNELGYHHFINDAGGSICELDDPGLMETLAAHTLILYISATKENEQELIRRAEKSPKPLYYRESFLDEQLENYMREFSLSYVAMIDPDDFVRWVFPKLFHARIPRYEAIADQYGYTITTDELSQVDSENAFVELVARAIDRTNAAPY